MLSYAHPEVLVDTHWATEHLNDPAISVVEIDVNTEAYDSGHIPGATGWDLYHDILQPDYSIIDLPALEDLLSRSGIANNTSIILYGNRNANAAMAFWFLKIYGHDNMHIMNGGRKKWIDEGRSLSTAVPTIMATTYKAKAPNWGSRARRDFVQQSIGMPGRVMVDVRNIKEYLGEMFWPSSPPLEGERAGHIPSAVHIPFELVLNEDGTFKSVEELQALYTSKGVTSDKEVITYCTVGGRSCNTWFVLKYLLGYPNVWEYEASWYEWGRLPDMPIER